MDRLFGWITLLDYGIKFFIICFVPYLILHESRNSPPTAVIIVFVTLSCCLIHLFAAFPSTLKSELNRSREKLTSLMAYSNTNWLRMSAEERQMFSIFQAQVNGDRLVANPKSYSSLIPVSCYLSWELSIIVLTCIETI